MVDGFCKMPWSALAITGRGQIKPCCQLKGNFGSLHNGATLHSSLESPEWREFRTQHLKGVTPDGCLKCKEREEKLGQSRRTWFDEKFSQFISHQAFSSSPTDEIVQMDLNLSNQCNLRCRMCGSWGSTKWIEEEKELAKDPVFKRESNPELLKPFDLSKDQINEILPYLSKVKRIDFKGGEPFLATHHDYVLEQLINTGRNKDIVLHYTTNGTFINKKLLQRLSAFKKVHLTFSVEGTGPLYSYIRGGRFDIKNLESNLLQYDQLENIRISFNVAIQIYNLLHLKTLWEYLNGLSLQRGSAKGAFDYTMVVDPPYLSPLIAPKSLLIEAASRIEGIDEMNHLYHQLQNTTPDPNQWMTFCKFTERLDTMRGESIFSVIPEFASEWKAQDLQQQLHCD